MISVSTALYYAIPSHLPILLWFLCWCSESTEQIISKFLRVTSKFCFTQYIQFKTFRNEECILYELVLKHTNFPT